MGHFGIRCAVAVLAVIALLAPAGVASALPRAGEDYPSWDEVQQARANEGAAAGMVASIDALLDDLQAESARLNELAITHSAIAAEAVAQRDAAAAKADHLERQANGAAERAEVSSAQAAQVVAALVRAGGQDLTMALLADHSEGLLGRLGMLERVGGQLDAIVRLAQFDRNMATALGEHADNAAADLAETAEIAEAAAADATRLAADADAKVADQQAHLVELYEQLAALQGTSAEQERLNRIGQQADNNSGAGGSGGSGDGDGSSDLGSIGNEHNDPTGAQAYAWGWFPHFGWDNADERWCLTMLWNRESGWRTTAFNASSGAYGIPQSLPGSKMAAVGADWRTNYQTQVIWGLVYINNGYGSPCAAWLHSEAHNWY